MPRIKFVPRFSGAIHGRTVNVIRKFFPKLCSEYEFDDLLQEAYIVFMKCKAASNADSPKWFMALYDRSLHNKMINLTEKCGRYISIEELDSIDEPVTHFDEAFLRVVLKQLPARVRHQIGIFLRGDPGTEQEAFRTLMGMFPE